MMVWIKQGELGSNILQPITKPPRSMLYVKSGQKWSKKDHIATFTEIFSKYLKTLGS